MLAIAGLMLLPADTSAVSLHPEVVEEMRANGTLDDHILKMIEARAKGVWAQTSESFRLSQSADDTPDTLRIVVILVDFSDNQWTSGVQGTVEYFENMMFSEGVMPNGSMKEFYLENSYGNFILAGEILGWYRMPETYAYYVDGQAGFGTYPQNAQKLAEDAVAAANPDVDYSQFDNDGDGTVEGLMIVHAGEGRETSGSDYHIHSHQWFMSTTQYYDGVGLRKYSMQPEHTRFGDGLVDIGVFCHEFGHVLGLPDLYDTDYSSEGVGDWSLMASGSWNRNGESPAHLDAWCKSRLGFLELVNIESNEIDWEFPQVEHSPVAVRVWADGTAGPEYFVVENRQKVGFDVGIPGSGLLIYHVDENMSGNQNENHYLVAVEQADGLFQLENNATQGDLGDPFPGSTNAREFTDLTTPDTRSYVGAITEVAVWNISDSDSLMTANLDIEFSRPRYILTDWQFSDAAGGDGDGFLELGETIDFYFALSNEWAGALGVTATLEANDPRVVFTVGTTGLGTVPSGGTADNYASPLQFEIPSDMDTVKVEFYLTLTQTSHPDSATHVFEQNLGGVKVLIVDDDSGVYGEYEHYFADALDAMSLTYSIWGKDTLGTPGTDQKVYPILIWLTGDHRDVTLTPTDRAFIKEYLDGGGKLFITGQDVAEHMSVDDPAMLADYFKCNYGGNFDGLSMVYGQDGSITGSDSLKFVLMPSNDGAANQLSKDYIVPLDGAVVGYRYESGDVCGLEIATPTYRAVFLGFGFESINNTYTMHGYGTREMLMERVIAFLEGAGASSSICGDVNGDSETEIDDVIYMIAHVYLGGPAPEPMETGDVDCNDTISMLDIVYFINYMFRGGDNLCAPCGD